VQFAGLQARNIASGSKPRQADDYTLSSDDVIPPSHQHADCAAGDSKMQPLQFKTATMRGRNSWTISRSSGPLFFFVQLGGQSLYPQRRGDQRTALEDRAASPASTACPRRRRHPQGHRPATTSPSASTSRIRCRRLRRMLPPGVELTAPVDTLALRPRERRGTATTLFLSKSLTASSGYFRSSVRGHHGQHLLSSPPPLVGTCFVLKLRHGRRSAAAFHHHLMTSLAASLSSASW